MSDNQQYTWWDKAGEFLGPERVRNVPIALLKVNDSQKKQQYTKTKQPYFDWVIQEEKMTVEQPGLEGRGVDFQNSTGTTEDTVNWGCL